MPGEVAETYLDCQVVAVTLRGVKSAIINDWSAICWAGDKIYQAKEYKDMEIMDRVGGDFFASGLIYGLMITCDTQLAINCGAINGVLAMTTPVDTSMARRQEVEALMADVGAKKLRYGKN